MKRCGDKRAPRKSITKPNRPGEFQIDSVQQYFAKTVFVFVLLLRYFIQNVDESLLLYSFLMEKAINTDRLSVNHSMVCTRGSLTVQSLPVNVSLRN